MSIVYSFEPKLKITLAYEQAMCNTNSLNLSYSRRSIAMNDAEVKLTLLGKQRNRPGKNRIKASLGFEPLKSAIDTSVVDLSPLCPCRWVALSTDIPGTVVSRCS